MHEFITIVQIRKTEREKKKRENCNNDIVSL